MSSASAPWLNCAEFSYNLPNHPLHGGWPTFANSQMGGIASAFLPSDLSSEALAVEEALAKDGWLKLCIQISQPLPSQRLWHTSRASYISKILHLVGHGSRTGYLDYTPIRLCSAVGGAMS